MRNPGGFGRLGDTPVLAIAHDKPLEGEMSGMETDWRAGQDRLSRLSTCGRLVVAKGLGHDIDLAAPRLVADAVRDMGGWAASKAPCASPP
jgi:hypothetical protein